MAEIVYTTQIHTSYKHKSIKAHTICNKLIHTHLLKDRNIFIVFSSYLFFFQLSFVFSIQIDKNLANMFQFTICQVAAITSTLDCPKVYLRDN